MKYCDCLSESLYSISQWMIKKGCHSINERRKCIPDFDEQSKDFKQNHQNDRKSHLTIRDDIGSSEMKFQTLNQRVKTIPTRMQESIRDKQQQNIQILQNHKISSNSQQQHQHLVQNNQQPNNQQQYIQILE